MKKIKAAMIAKQEYIYIYIYIYKKKIMLNDNIRKATIIAILKKLNSIKKMKFKKTTKTICFKKQNNVE